MDHYSLFFAGSVPVLRLCMLRAERLPQFPLDGSLHPGDDPHVDRGAVSDAPVAEPLAFSTHWIFCVPGALQSFNGGLHFQAVAEVHKENQLL